MAKTQNPSVMMKIEEVNVVETGLVDHVEMVADSKDSFSVTLYQGKTEKSSGWYDRKRGILKIRNSIGYGFRRALENGKPAYYWIDWRGNEDGGLCGDAQVRTEKLIKELDKVVEKINFNTSAKMVAKNKDGTKQQINVVGDFISIYTTNSKGEKVGSYLDVTDESIDFENYGKDGKLLNSFHDNTYTIHNKDGSSVSYKEDKTIFEKREKSVDGQETCYTIYKSGKMEVMTPQGKDITYFNRSALEEDGIKPPFLVREHDPYKIHEDKKGERTDISQHKGDLKGLLYAVLQKNMNDMSVQNEAYDLLSLMVQDPLGKTTVINEVNNVVRNKIERSEVFALDDGNFAIVGLYTDTFQYKHAFCNDDSEYAGLVWSVIDPDKHEIVQHFQTGHHKTQHTSMDHNDFLGIPHMNVKCNVGDSISANLTIGSNHADSVVVPGCLASEKYVTERADTTKNNYKNEAKTKDTIIKEIREQMTPVMQYVRTVAKDIQKAYEKDGDGNTNYQQAMLDLILKNKEQYTN